MTRKEWDNLDAPACAKLLWMRLGAAIALTQEEMDQVVAGDKHIILNKIRKGEFQVTGDSYAPEAEEDESYWPVEHEINFDF